MKPIWKNNLAVRAAVLTFILATAMSLAISFQLLKGELTRLGANIAEELIMTLVTAANNAESMEEWEGVVSQLTTNQNAGVSVAVIDASTQEPVISSPGMFDFDGMLSRLATAKLGEPLIWGDSNVWARTVRLSALIKQRIGGEGEYIIVLQRQVVLGLDSWNHESITTLWVLGFFTILLPTFAYWMSQGLRLRMTELASTSRELAGGQHSLDRFIVKSDEFGQLASAISYLREQMQGQMEDLESSRRLMQSVLAEVRDGIIILDEQGRVSVINRTALEIFQTDAISSIGRSLAQVVFDHQVVDLWAAFVRDGVERQMSLILPRSKRELQVSVYAFDPIAGSYSFVLFQDLTRLRLLETVRQDFVSNLSHELRTPIASIKALSETLQGGALENPAAARRFLERIDVEIDSLFEMVAELLDLSKIESGAEELHITVFDPCSHGQAIIERMRPLVERSGLSLTFECHASQEVSGDQVRIEQLLTNLISNAIKFSIPGGTIQIAIEQKDEKTIYSVADSGIGIAANDLPRVFERFYKSDSSRSTAGTGLGLSIAKHIAEGHGGKIWVDSEEGRGATFTFELPKIPEPKSNLGNR